MMVPAGLGLAVSARGRVRLLSEAAERPPEPELARRIRDAFARGEGAGLLHLGAAEVDTAMSPSLSWWRDVAQLYVSGLCSAEDVPLPRGELDRMLASIPPMEGAENVTAAGLEEIWNLLADETRAELRAFAGSRADWLAAQHASWSLVGRVVFHLAENKGSDERPFAFLATYTDRIRAKAGKARPRHLPLRHALAEYAGARNRAGLVALLAPVSRAAEKSALVRELVESGDLYHPLAWTADEAHRLIKEVPVLEDSGLTVRVGEFWKHAARGMHVQIKIGNRSPSLLGIEALTDFQAEIVLDGERLTEDDVRRVLSRSEGLTLVKGRWVEVDRAQLTQMLARFDALRGLEERGVSLGEAMRLAAGASIGEAREAIGAAPAWEQVVAGEWLGEILRGMRGPDGIDGIAAPKTLAGTLRGYQEVGLRWLWFLGKLGLGACLADDMGLGKTIQVLSLLLLLKQRREAAGPHLLVVPATLLANWESEAARFAPSLKVTIVHPSAPSPEPIAARVAGADLVVTTYGFVRRDDTLTKTAWDLVILDEAQAIKNPGAAQTRAVKALKSRRRVALTGTPVENRLGDLWSIFDFLNPGLLGSTKAFAKFCKAIKTDYRPLRELTRPYILRRLKTDKTIAPDLPDKTELIAYSALSKAQTVLYLKSVQELKTHLAALKVESNDMRRRGIVLSFLTRFKQICNHPSQWLGSGSFDPEDSGKYARLVEIVETIAARQEKVIVFTQFQTMAAPLAAWLTPLIGEGVVLHGGTPVKARREIVRRFQEDENVRFFVATVKAGGTGLNLTAASHVIHFDRWWNPAVENQATDRAFRIGQTKNVLVHKMVCRGTIEEKIDALLTSKKKLADELLAGGGEPSLSEMGDQELLDLVSLDVGRAAEALG